MSPLLVGLLAAGSAVPSPKPSPFLFSVPASSAEPSKAEAEVVFVSNGYWLDEKNCAVTRSSGDVDADKQACKTVIFRAANKPVKAVAPVWTVQPLPEGYAGPTTRSKSPPVTTNDYPSASLTKGEQGTVVVRVAVNEMGEATECIVVSSSGHSRLDNQAKRNLCKRLKLQPATLDGKPVASINFTQVAFYQGK